MTMLESLRDAVLYKRIKYPLSLSEALAYLNVNGILTHSGQPFTKPEVQKQLQQAKSNQRVISAHDMYWFADIFVSDSAYLSSLLRILRQKNTQKTLA